MNQELNLIRIVFFMLGFMAGVMTLSIMARPNEMPPAKLIYNQCPRNADMTSSCGLGAVSDQ